MHIFLCIFISYFSFEIRYYSTPVFRNTWTFQHNRLKSHLNKGVIQISRYDGSPRILPALKEIFFWHICCKNIFNPGCLTKGLVLNVIFGFYVNMKRCISLSAGLLPARDSWSSYYIVYSISKKATGQSPLCRYTNLCFKLFSCTRLIVDCDHIDARCFFQFWFTFAHFSGQWCTNFCASLDTEFDRSEDIPEVLRALFAVVDRRDPGVCSSTIINDPIEQTYIWKEEWRRIRSSIFIWQE